VMASPMARLQQKTQAAVTTGSAGSAGGIPRAMVLTAYSALSPVSGLDSHHRFPRNVLREA
jgi:hypothetical protein